MTLFDADEPGGNRPKPSRKPRRKRKPDKPPPDHVPHTPEILLRRGIAEKVSEHWSLVRKALQTPGVDLDSVVSTIALAESDAGWKAVDGWCAAADGTKRPHELPGEKLAPLRMRYLLIIRDLVRAEVMDRAKREGLRLPWT